MLTKCYKVEESTNFSGVIRRGFSAKVIFQQKLEGKKGANYEAVGVEGRERILYSGNTKCKGPEAGAPEWRGSLM